MYTLLLLLLRLNAMKNIIREFATCKLALGRVRSASEAAISRELPRLRRVFRQTHTRDANREKK